MKRNLKHMILLLILIIWTFLILFLSFQTGTDTANTSMRFTRRILEFFVGSDISQDVLHSWDMMFRLWAHPFIFFFFSILAMKAVSGFVKKQRYSSAFTGISGVILAVFTEAGKWNIPGRHFNWGEMWLNIAGVVSGIIVCMAITAIWRRRIRLREKKVQ